MPTWVIDTTGKELVVVRRNDSDLADDPRAKALAVADNRVGELDLDWDVEVLRQLHDDGIDLQHLVDARRTRAAVRSARRRRWYPRRRDRAAPGNINPAR